MGTKTPGRRIHDVPQSWGENDYPDSPDNVPWRPGDYWRSVHGQWEACAPNGTHVTLAGHVIVEHGDGTITVLLSIEANRGNRNPRVAYWHGYLIRGHWEECD